MCVYTRTIHMRICVCIHVQYTCAYVCVYTYNTHAHMCVHRRTTHAHMCIHRHTIDMYQQGGKEHLRCASTRRASTRRALITYAGSSTREPAYVWHDSLICTTWLIQMCDLTQRDVWHDSCASLALLPTLCVTWLIHMCDLTYSNVFS